MSSMKFGNTLGTCKEGMVWQIMKFNHSMKIGQREISEDSPAYIIAEAGVNHNGKMEIALKLIDAACEAGVDAVKFQMFKSEDIILRNIDKAPYQKKTTDASQSQFEMLKKLELTEENNEYLKDYCEKKGITFLSTPFEKNSLDALAKLNVPAIKIAATDLTNIQYLKQVAALGKPIILSAGMCYLEEVRRALEAIYPSNKDVVLLQCTANYPIEDNEANLNIIDTFHREFDILVGYSDHSKGVGASPFAVAKGAKVIEKHFTLDRNAEGPDHKASVTPEELKQLVQDIRRVESYLGTTIKTPTFAEQFTRRSLQKCFVAAKEIRKGEPFTADNIVAKRTNGAGISALYYDELLGRIACRDFAKDDILEV